MSLKLQIYFFISTIFLIFLKNTASFKEIRGIPPHLLEKYSSGRFECLNEVSKVIQIPLEYINDNFCDCADETDEPGTSACPKGKFYCQNRGFRHALLPSSRVNDGICDCCDGSDEYETLKCGNTCEELGKNFRNQVNQYIEKHKQGYKLKQEYIEWGQRRKNELEQSNVSQGEEITVLEQQIESLESEVNHKQQLFDENLLLFQQEWKEQQSSLKMKQLLTNSQLQETNENFQEIPSEEIPDGKSDDSQNSEEIIDQIVAENDAENSTENDFKPTEDEYPYSVKVLQAELQEVKQKFDLLTASVKEKKDANDKISLELGKDFGADLEFWKLHMNCLEKISDGYTYKICPFGEAFQISSSGSSTLLGHFEEWKGESSSNNNATKIMIFSKGQQCWAGPERSVTVTFNCGLNDLLVSVAEPNKCEYVAEIETPAACISLDFDFDYNLPLFDRFHDEL